MPSDTAINSPRIQDAPLLWAAFCLFGLGVGIWLMVDYSPGTESWFVGLMLAGLVIFGFATIQGWWLMSQREVTFGPDVMRVRRWSDASLGRSGEAVPLAAVRSVGLVVDNGKKVKIESEGVPDISFWAGLWPRSEIDRLLHEASVRGIAVAAEW